MVRTIITYGVIAGTVIIGSIIISQSLGFDSDHAAGLEWLGYLVMIAAISLIFFGIKQYRDRDLGGVMRFVTGLQVGLGISLVASVIYVAAWEVTLSMTDHAFIHEYAAAKIAQYQGQNPSEAEMAVFVEEIDAMKEAYAKPMNRLFMTFLEIFPVGVLITLISAAILRRSHILPAEA